MTGTAATDERIGEVAPAEGRAAATRRTLLLAARDVFAAQGFAETGIADVVSRAGASVGSLYHHFGGKADLYLALYEDFADRQEARAAVVVRDARRAGEEDPLRLFVAGARAYIEGCWTERDLAPLFLAGGGPPGFDLVQRRRNREWMRRNAALLHAEGEQVSEALVLVITTVIGEVGSEVALSESHEKAQKLTDEVLTLIARMGDPR